MSTTRCTCIRDGSLAVRLVPDPDCHAQHQPKEARMGNVPVHHHGSSANVELTTQRQRLAPAVYAILAVAVPDDVPVLGLVFGVAALLALFGGWIADLPPKGK